MDLGVILVPGHMILLDCKFIHGPIVVRVQPALQLSAVSMIRGNEVGSAAWSTYLFFKPFVIENNVSELNYVIVVSNNKKSIPVMDWFRGILSLVLHSLSAQVCRQYFQAGFDSL